MDRLLAISDRANHALHALALAAVSDGPITAKDAAERLGISPTYLAKVLQPLARAGFLESSRGAAGGFTLVRPAESLSCLEVLELLDGPFPERECLFRSAVCASGTCVIKGLCAEVAAEARAALARSTVADIAAAFR